MLVLKRVERPRELKWYQAGAMLYGDWGTSKAYVLGIAFALSGHASWFFLGLMSVLTAVVGYCYTIVCRVYPDGGGVYSSVKQRSQLLAVIGALLLIADYVVTASLSALVAFHYFNFPHPAQWAVASILIIGAINWLGPAKGGTIAAWIGVAASIAAGILFLSTLPHLPHVELRWPDTHHWAWNWSIFVGIVLAFSGVESIANMTGIMVEPVEKTSSKAILPVLLEVSILTFLLGIAMNAIPGLTEHTADMLRVLGDHYIGPWYGQLISIVFGFLLLSAANTAVSAFVSLQFLLSQDGELPPLFRRLNRYGMPVFSLIVATLVPAVVVIAEPNVVGLAALYAVGVVGAIMMNLGTTATNPGIRIRGYERAVLTVVAVILFFIEGTICFQKHHALIFAAAVLAVGLILRKVAKVFIHVRVPEVASVSVLTVSEAKEIKSFYKSSFLVGLRALNQELIEEAVIRAKALREKAIYLTCIEETPPGAELPQEVSPSPEVLELFEQSQREIERNGMTAVPVWQFGHNPGRMIAHAAVELDVNMVMIGATKRSALVNLFRGNVLKTLSSNLPQDCRLTITG